MRLVGSPWGASWFFFLFSLMPWVLASEDFPYWLYQFSSPFKKDVFNLLFPFWVFLTWTVFQNRLLNWGKSELCLNLGRNIFNPTLSIQCDIYYLWNNKSLIEKITLHPCSENGVAIKRMRYISMCCYETILKTLLI